MKPTLEAVLYEALTALGEADERDLLLEHACSGNPALRRRVEDLLAMRDEAVKFFEFPDPVGEIEEAKGSGIDARIGRYQLIERIGSGGCGTVYLAEQSEPVTRRVALKLIRLGLENEETIARFRLESQVLASMDHPNIARILDGGTTPGGRPYFVMEWVPGTRISRYCEQKPLNLHDRLTLFLQVCEAIQHAHQKGLIHRDIKPSNILVHELDGAPQAKVIDFGIVKTTGNWDTNPGNQDKASSAIGTPSYMSPEQLAGSDVDTRSDIHALGTLLREIIFGIAPAGLKRNEGGLSATETLTAAEAFAIPTRRQLSPHEEPLPGARPLKWAALIRGDLGWIIAKATAHSPADRYQTANALAMDVRRYLDDEPVVAAPPRTSYLLGKWIRRNRATFVAGCFIFLSLAVGLGLASQSWLREKQARISEENMRRVAETARSQEADLRRRAELREIVAKAAVRLSYGDYQSADHLLDKVPPLETPPTLEAVNCLHSVGLWHVSKDQWDRAAKRFEGVAHAMARVDPTDSNEISLRLIGPAAAIARSGDQEAYARFRQTVQSRFGDTRNPIIAEQVLKIVMLLPLEDFSSREIHEFRDLLINDLKSFEENSVKEVPNYVLWSRISLALYYLRSADPVRAREHIQKYLEFGRSEGARDATAKLVDAMALFQLGHHGVALESIDKATEIMRRRPSKIPLEGEQQGAYWFDWTIAAILLDEARLTVQGASSPTR